MDKNLFVKIADIAFKKIHSVSELSQDELRLWDEWINASNENQKLWNELRSGVYDTDFERISTLIDQHELWKRIECIVRKQKQNLVIKFYASAAVAVLLLFIGFMYLSRSSNSEDCIQQELIYPAKRQTVLVLNDGKNIPLNVDDTLVAIENSEIKISSGQIQYLTADTVQHIPTLSFNTMIVPKGGVYSLILSDGSKVFLNSDSELTYPVYFDKSRREVTLKGEAFFEIAHDSKRPFIVKTDMIAVKVLGTVFNIMAYENEPQIQTTLLSGEVEVLIDNTNNSNILKPGYQAVFERTNKQMCVRKVDIPLRSLWRDGIIFLEDNSLESVMRMLSRWYDVEYVYQDSLLGSHTFTGKIDRNIDLNNVLKKLSLLGGPSFIVKDGIIYISEKKNNR